MLAECFGVKILGYVTQVGDIKAQIPDPAAVTLEQIEATPVRCPDPIAAEKMIELIMNIRKEEDSIGGVSERQSSLSKKS